MAGITKRLKAKVRFFSSFTSYSFFFSGWVSEKSKLLPTDYQVKSGEEGEEVVFSQNAKLFRFTDKEWKERGVGVLKILKRNDSSKFFCSKNIH